MKYRHTYSDRAKKHRPIRRCRRAVYSRNIRQMVDSIRNSKGIGKIENERIIRFMTSFARGVKRLPNRLLS